jgi:hypothetical protein
LFYVSKPSCTYPLWSFMSSNAVPRASTYTTYHIAEQSARTDPFDDY